MNPLWLRRERALREMIGMGLTDVEIAARWRVSPTTVSRMREGVEIDPPGPFADWSMTVSPPRPVTTYEEDGRTVTRYPSAVADGADINPYTAKPRGRK